MTRQQIILIGSTLLVFFVLYFGCETRTNKIKSLEKSRSLSIENTDISILLNQAKIELSSALLTEIELLEQEQEGVATTDSLKVEVLKKLSGKWFEAGYPHVSGYYAELVAEIENNESAWSIAGTTYLYAVKGVNDQKIKEFSTNHAVKAFENAVSLNPTEVSYQVNLATCYTENPPQDNPMKGIQMLLGLDKKYPDNPVVLNTLATLAIKTGQYQRAIERIEKVLEVDPSNQDAICLAAIAFKEIGELEKSSQFQTLCRK